MKTKVILNGLMVSLFALCATAGGTTVGDIGVSSADRAKEVVLGEWHGDYEKCKALADSANIPMIVYYGTTGCGRCATLTATLMGSQFESWRKGKNLILLYMKQGDEGNGYSDSSAGKRFIKGMTDEGGFPYFGYYYKPASGEMVKKAYGKSARLFEAQAIIDEAVSLFGDALNGGGVTPPPPGPINENESETPVVQIDPATVFSGSASYSAAYYNPDGSLAGVMTITAAKANARTGKSKVSGKITTVAGKRKTFRGDVPTGVNATGSFKVSGLGTVNLVFGRDAVSGEFNGGAVVPATIGGDISGNRVFSLLDTPAVAIPEGYEILKELLPVERAFVAGKKWDFGKAATVKYTGKNGDFTLSGADSANPSALKLTYKAATGVVSGSFKVHASNAGSVTTRRPSLKKISLKVTGLVVDGVGYLYTVYRNEIVGSGVVR